MAGLCEGSNEPLGFLKDIYITPPPGIFPMGIVKDVAYRTPVGHLQELCTHMTAAITWVNVEMLGWTWAEAEYWLNSYLA
ncbi:hypothetical protein ANN_09506 [Periplaneta americana]|uniref:Per a allergen n=1 Tax=Periplaneta americana TaxID=6978 RepID=A0ABQ8TPG8_PERAM|nr:hypothetical protein ANN_09506 [Periplaneta americana]